MGHLYNDDTDSHEKGPVGSRNERVRNSLKLFNLLTLTRRTLDQ